jgi:hypothetical protein
LKIASNRFGWIVVLPTVLVALNVLAVFDEAFSAEPVKIGFSIALTGAYAGNSAAILLCRNANTC